MLGHLGLSERVLNPITMVLIKQICYGLMHDTPFSCFNSHDEILAPFLQCDDIYELGLWDTIVNKEEALLNGIIAITLEKETQER